MSVGQVLLPGRVVDDAPRRKPWSPALAWGERLVRAAEPRVVERSGAVAITERIAVFALPLGVYLWAAWVLMIDHLSQQGDAGSRLANAYYVFFGKDPHLAAIGFVWQPLTSITEMPLLLLKGVYPDLTRLGFDANIMSAVFMAGAAYQTFRLFEDLGLSWWVRWGLTLLTYGNPLMLYYGANGMSEALFLFTLILTARLLARWIDGGGTRYLTGASLWLGLAYGARNEAVFAAALGALVVFGVSVARHEGSADARRRAGLTDLALFVGPFVLVFVGWALTSYIIVGHLFEQLSSQYGNSAEIAAIGRKVDKVHFLRAALGMTEALAPFLPLGLVAGISRAVRSRDLRVLAPVVVLGGTLLFEILAYADGQLNPFERYFIYAIPLLAITLACAAAPVSKSTVERAEERLAVQTGRAPRWLAARQAQRKLLTTSAGLLAVIAMAPGFVTTVHEMWASPYGSVDRAQLQFVLFPHSRAAEKSLIRQQFPAILHATAIIDRLHAPNGSVLVDDFDEYIDQVILASKNPTQFVTPNDQGWEETFGVPYQFGIRYMIVAQPGSIVGNEDELNKQFPTLYATGQGLATLDGQFSIPYGPTFRIYKVIRQYS